RSPLYPLSLHDALPISNADDVDLVPADEAPKRCDRELLGSDSTRSRNSPPGRERDLGERVADVDQEIGPGHWLAGVYPNAYSRRSEEHTSELQSLTNLV